MRGRPGNCQVCEEEQIDERIDELLAERLGIFEDIVRRRL